MSLFGKILAVLNIFGAIFFVAAALMDYSRREAWSYANFVHDTAISGLPVSDAEVDSHEVRLRDKLNAATRAEWFPNDPVFTQLDEVDRVQKAVNNKIASEGSTLQKKAAAEARVLIPFSEHETVREWRMSVPAYFSGDDDKALEKRLRDAFPVAVHACVMRAEDLKFAQAFHDACQAEGGPSSLAFEEALLTQLPAKPEKTFDEGIKAVRGAAKGPADASPDAVYNEAAAFLKYLRDDPAATLAKPTDPPDAKDTFGDVYQAACTSVEGDLQKQLDEQYALAKTPTKQADPNKPLRDAQRAAIAHLLFNLVEALHDDAPEKGVIGSPDYKRVATVVGLKAAVTEINNQADRLRRMADEVQALRETDRGSFVIAHRIRIDELKSRAVALHEANDQLARLAQQLADEQQTVRKRQDDVKAAETDLAAARAETDAELVKLRKQSDALHDLRVQDRDLLGENLQLEKQIRGLEKKP